MEIGKYTAVQIFPALESQLPSHHWLTLLEKAFGFLLVKCNPRLGGGPFWSSGGRSVKNDANEKDNRDEVI